MEKVEDKRVRVFKVDKETEIKNFVFLEKKYLHCPKLLVIPGQMLSLWDNWEGDRFPYLFFDGIVVNSNLTMSRPAISPPNNFDDSIAIYTYGSKSAVVEGRLHFFGGPYGPQRVKLLRDS